MATKMKKNVKNHQNGDRPNKTILGVDAKAIGAAVAAAVVGEIAQAAITRSAKALNQSDQFSQARDTVQESASSVKENLASSDLSLKGATQGVTKVVKDVLHEIKPVITEAIAAAISSTDAANQTVNQTIEGGVDTVKAAAEDTTDQLGGTVEAAVDTANNSAARAKQSLQTLSGDAVGAVKSAFEELKPAGKKDKKNKKKSAKRKGKKNKK